MKNNPWEGRRVGITGASGTLGKALSKELVSKGAYVIGITHSDIQLPKNTEMEPQEWVKWECGKEDLLDNIFTDLDILVLNHGINPQGRQAPNDLNAALEINAISTWRLMERFENMALKKNKPSKPKEIWVNSSEAEILPALSPVYEISKRLIGEITSLRKNNLSSDQKQWITIRKLILGPFYSKLNPLGIMPSSLVASLILKQIELNFYLIIVTPNPITFLAMPLAELSRSIYSLSIKKIFNGE